MKLYFSPLRCSLAPRICLYEARSDATFVEVDAKTKKTEDGLDFRSVHSLGLVPTLALDEGAGILTENAAILQYIADRYPAAKLAPQDILGRAQVAQWLAFVGTELHKALYTPLLDPNAPEGAKTHALSKAESRLAWLNGRLEGREHLLDTFSVADAYLFAVLNWSSVTPVDLKPWPAITAYQERLRERPSVKRAFAEELALYVSEQARHAA